MNNRIKTVFVVGTVIFAAALGGIIRVTKLPERNEVYVNKKEN